MGDAGSPYARFRRALLTGNLTIIRAAASELPNIALEDALVIVLAMRRADAAAFDRAAVRWLARFALEANGVELSDLQVGAAALDALPDAAARDTLAALCIRRGLTRAARALETT